MDQSTSTPGVGRSTNIVDTAIAAGDFSIFVACIKAAGLSEALAAPGPFTVFAPADAAFRKLPGRAYEELLGDAEKLSAILNYHVVLGQVMAEDLKAGEIMTQQGTTLMSMPSSSSGPCVNAARVVKADLIASNGVIHGIDAVILPKDWQWTAAAA